MANSHYQKLTPQEIWKIIARHKKKIVLCPLLAVAFGALVALYFPRTYHSQAQIFLRLGRESVGLDPTATTGQTISMQQGDRKDEVKSAMEVIKSRGVIAQVVDQLGPEYVLNGEPNDGSRNRLAEVAAAPLRMLVDWYRSIDPISDHERAMVVVERHLYVGAERGATLIEITYEAKSPPLAQAVCAAFVDVYRKEHMRIQRSEESRPFFEEQQDRLRLQLDGALEAVRKAKNEMGLADINQRRTTLEAQYGAVELDRLTTQQHLAASTARADDLEKQLSQLPERLVASTKQVPNAGADLLRGQLYALEVKSMELQSRYTAKHPQVQAVNDQLRDAQQVMASQSEERTETIDDVNPIHRQLSLELKQERSVLAGLKARLAALDKQNATILTEVRTLNASEVQIDQLSRDADLARDKFFQYAKNLEESRIDKALENNGINNLSVVLPASLNERPVSPSKPLVAIATLLLATAGTTVIVLGSEWLRGARSAADVANRADLRPEPASIQSGRVHRHEVSVKTNGHAEPSRQDA